MNKVAAKSFTDLLVWQKSHAFVLHVYEMTKSFPREELYGLTSQFRRAAVSIPANIAEGFKKRGPADKVRFLNIAHGSLEECRYYCILSEDLEYGSFEDCLTVLDDIGKMISAYSTSILNSTS